MPRGIGWRRYVAFAGWVVDGVLLFILPPVLAGILLVWFARSAVQLALPIWLVLWGAVNVAVLALAAMTMLRNILWDRLGYGPDGRPWWYRLLR